MEPEKEEKERTRLTVGVIMSYFSGNISAPNASVTNAKCFFNNVVSAQGVLCILSNIKHFYLNNILPDHEFIRIPLKISPQEIIYAYNLTALVNDQG